MEKPPKAQEQVEELDASIWTLFVKKVGDDQVSVRLPGDPVYRYTEIGELEVVSQAGGELFRLSIQQEGVMQPDRLYSSEGQWVHEHCLEAEDHFYLFQTISSQPDSPAHLEFISSFSIEKTR